jgi:anti-sigma-K factor RskA
MSPDLHHLSGAYAVDALDDAERTSFEQHLAVCADCRAEVAELSATAHSLASFAEATPPPSLRAAVLTGIAQVRPLPPLTRDAAGPAPTDPTPTVPPGDVAGTDDGTGEPDAGGTVVPIRRRPRTAWFAAAAAAAVIAVGGLAWSPWSDDAASQSPMAQVAAAADAMKVTSTKGGTTTTVAYSKQLGKAAISVTGMPPAPDGKTYQLWYVGPSGAATSAGLLGVDAEGSGQALMAGAATPPDKVAMTVEPAGGSAQPTTEPLVVLALA